MAQAMLLLIKEKRFLRQHQNWSMRSSEKKLLRFAKFCGILLVTPPLRFRPSKEQVIESDVKEFASKHTMYAGADYANYEKWDAEKFILKNNGVGIPAVYHKQEHARGCVILAHGFGQNRYASVPYAELFRSLGFSTLLFDERCFGESEAPNGGFGELEASDIAALINWVKEKCGKNEKIVLHIKENNPIKAVENSEVPICIIHGDADQAVPAFRRRSYFQGL